MTKWDRSFALVCLAAGLLLLLVAAFLYALDQRMTSGVSYSLIAAIALLIAYGILAPTAVLDLIRSRQLRFGSLSAIVTLAVLGILVLVNVVAGRGFQSLDLTRAGRFTLSPKSVLVAQRLDSDLTVTGFYRPGQGSDQQTAADLLGRYQVHTKRLQVVFKDPDANATEATRLKVTIPGSLVFQYKGKPPVVLTLASQQEQDVTSAILKLESNRTPLICWAAGEGERDLKESNNVFGYSEAATQLDASNYKTQDLLLSQQQSVPPACDIVAIVGLQKPLAANAVQITQAYLAAGGKLLIAVDPWQEASVIASVNVILKPYGAGFSGALVVDADPAHSAIQDPTTPVAFDYGPSPIVKNLAKRFSYFPQPTGVEIASADGVTGIQVAGTTTRSYSVQIPRDNITRGGTDRAGPFTLMETLEKTDSGKHQRLVLIGTSAVAENRALPPNERSGGVNLQLLLGSMDWLSEQEDLIAIPAKPPNAVALPLTQQELAVNVFVTMILIPALIAGLGVAVWWRRRLVY